MISMRILLVEDEENVRYMFRRFIGDLTSKITECTKLSEALTVSKEDEFDLIVLDLRLLDANMEQTLDAIPELKANTNAPVVVVTGAPIPDIQDRVTKAGGDYCIPKGDLFSRSKALLMALHAAVLKHPRAHAGDDYLSHVSMLERLVHAA